MSFCLNKQLRLRQLVYMLPRADKKQTRRTQGWDRMETTRVSPILVTLVQRTLYFDKAFTYWFRSGISFAGRRPGSERRNAKMSATSLSESTDSVYAGMSLGPTRRKTLNASSGSSVSASAGAE